MLGLEARVAEDGGGGDHGEEVRGRHGRPGFGEEGGIVYVESWGYDAGEAGPVLFWGGGEGGFGVSKNFV